MPELNGNDVYISINGRDVGGIWRGFEMNLSIGDEDVSAGAGIDWEKHAAKLKVVGATATLVYNTDSVVADIAAIIGATEGHVVPVVYGPENNTAGKPKHDQDFLITGISGPSTAHEKSLVMFEIELNSSGEPRSNLYDGDTF